MFTLTIDTAQRQETKNMLYELLLVTGDGCDAASGIDATWEQCLDDLRAICVDVSDNYYHLPVEYTTPIDGHGIIYTIETGNGEPTLTVHYRYHISPVGDAGENR